LLLAQSAVAFNMVKYLGAVYLIYLGIRMLMQKDAGVVVQSVPAHGAWRAFLEGIVVEALNLKTAFFFLAFLPQFVSLGEPMVPQLVVLGSICVALNTLVDVGTVLAADGLLESGPARAARARALTRSSGVTMIGLGAYLAMARRA
jgi:threonine/homoserine/homoserine lactone efflux protein